MKVLVTGASGHIGYHICKLLLDQNYQVRAFIRKSSFKEHLEKLPLEIFYGDILIPENLQEAMKDIDIVFHTAAVYQLTPLKRKYLSIAATEKKVNIITTAVTGTINLFQAAKNNNIKKIIYTSSVETIGISYNKNNPLSESYHTQDFFYDYSLAKSESEKLALQLAKKTGIFTVICNPSTVIGKNDYKLTPSNALLLRCIKHNLFYVEAGQSLVDVDDVAWGHIQALNKGRNLERYILSGENIEIKDLLILIKNILNIKKPSVKLTKPFLYPLAIICDILSAMTGTVFFISRRKINRIIGGYSYYDCSKAKFELGYNPKQLKETLPETINWLIEKYS